MMAYKLSEKDLLATFTKQLRDCDEDEAQRVRENIAKIQVKEKSQHKKRRQAEPVERMTGLEKSFLHWWRVCGGDPLDWLFGQKLFPERPRMHVDFYHEKKRIAVEIDGGQWQGISGHNSGTGLQGDAEKLALCNKHGITLYRLPTSLVTYDGVMEIYEVVKGENSHE